MFSAPIVERGDSDFNLAADFLGSDLRLCLRDGKCNLFLSKPEPPYDITLLLPIKSCRRISYPICMTPM